MNCCGLCGVAQKHMSMPGIAWVLETPTKGEGVFSVVGPDGTAIEAQVISSGRAARLALPAARLPGIYSVKQGGAVVGAAAVNVDPRESDTRPIPLARSRRRPAPR